MQAIRQWFGLLLISVSQLAWSQPASDLADWTLLIYMNAKNSLEGAAITDFNEMAKIGSSKRVNVVVQLGRPRRHHSRAEGTWSGVYRFLVTKGQRPIPSQAVLDLQKKGLGTDMANPDTLEDFLRWGSQTYPAKRKLLVVWSHGQGWRFKPEGEPASTDTPNKVLQSRTERQVLAGLPGEPRWAGGHRAVANDEDTGHILYNRQIQDSLLKLAQQGLTLDLIGFDACLMSMVETAYALRKTADFMVASEELEPFNGWNYRSILAELNSQPDADPLALAKILVRAYQKQYEDGNRTTLSAISLRHVAPLAQSLSSLAYQLIGDLPAQKDLITQARGGLRAFGDWDQPPLQTSVDLRLFLTHLKKGNPNPAIVNQLNTTLRLLDDVVVEHYRSAPVANDGYGGNGLAIYFPQSKEAFERDRFSDGYQPSNRLHPLEFVTTPETAGWAKLVRILAEQELPPTR